MTDIIETDKNETDKNETDTIETGEAVALTATVSLAMKGFHRAAAALNTAVEALETSPATGEKQVVADIRALNGAMIFALKMWSEARGAATGYHNGSGGIDLDAARSEIGLRLDCLRTAGGGGGVSGWPE